MRNMESIASTSGYDARDCNCIIEQLVERPFNSYHFKEKEDIIARGKPKPDLDIQKKTKNCIRHFQSNIYETIWVTACKKLNRMFCWPCLLFSLDKNIWTTGGFSDLNNFHKAGKRHEQSKAHILAFMFLKQFGKTRIDFSLIEQHKLIVKKHNENVKKNRYILSRLIDVTCFLAKQELAFRGHEESSQSSNRGNFVELLYAFGELDSNLKSHLENSTVFSGLSSDIQNDLIKSLSETMMKVIKSEVKDALFVGIIVDENTDISKKSQLTTILRYVSSHGIIEERFLGFSDISSDRSAGALSQQIFKVLTDFKCSQKLVAQAYDGAAVMAGEIQGLQALVKTKYEEALFVHCYAHKLNLVLLDSVSYIKECKVFFMTLSGVAAFFSKSTKRTHALDQEVKKRFPNICPTRLNFSSRLIETVVEYKQEFEQMLLKVIENAHDWDSETVQASRGIISSLKDFDFIFLLNVFSNILPMSDSLYQTLQKKTFEINYCITKVNEFQDFVKFQRTKFDSVWEITITEHENYEIIKPKKRKRIDGVESGDEKAAYRQLYYQIIDVIETNLETRFSEMDKLKFLELLDPKKFATFRDAFPENCFASLKENYGNHFDFTRLRSELSVIYETEQFSVATIGALHQHLKVSELEIVFPEVCKLSSLILTIPVTSASAEHSFSTSKRIKTYLRNSQAQDQLSALAFLTIEKQLLLKLREEENFYDKVIEVFAQKNRRIELKYK